MQLTKETSLNIGNVSSTILTYSTIRKQDPKSITQMDVYASLIKQQGKSFLVNDLARDLLKITESRPEPWMVLAHYNEMINQFDRALFFCDHALSIDKKHFQALKLKSNLLINSKLFPEALVILRFAMNIKKDIEVYQSLVSCLISSSRLKEAYNTAKEALSLIHNSFAMSIVGTVLVAQGKIKDAKINFKNAIEADSKCFIAVSSLADLYINEKSFQEAVELMEKTSLVCNSEAMEIKFGDVYFAKGDFNLAMGRYATALNINPDSVLAKAGIARVEKRLNGDEQDEEIGDFDEEELVIND